MDYKDKDLSEAAEKIAMLSDSTSHRMTMPEIKGGTGFNEKKIVSAFNELESKSIDIERPEKLAEISKDEGSIEEKGSNSIEVSEDKKDNIDNDKAEQDIHSSNHKDLDSGTREISSEKLDEINARVQRLENKVDGVIDRLDTMMNVGERSNGELSSEAQKVFRALKSIEGDVSVDKLRKHSNLSEQSIKQGYKELKSKGKI